MVAFPNACFIRILIHPLSDVKMRHIISLGIFATALAAPLVEQVRKPVYWLLAGDSTTAPNGGWGDAFLTTTVAPGSSGYNYGHSGATTASFRAGGDWSKVMKDIGAYKKEYDVYVTIQASALSIPFLS